MLKTHTHVYSGELNSCVYNQCMFLLDDQKLLLQLIVVVVFDDVPLKRFQQVKTGRRSLSLLEVPASLHSSTSTICISRH